MSSNKIRGWALAALLAVTGLLVTSSSASAAWLGRYYSGYSPYNSYYMGTPYYSGYNTYYSPAYTGYSYYTPGYSYYTPSYSYYAPRYYSNYNYPSYTYPGNYSYYPGYRYRVGPVIYP